MTARQTLITASSGPTWKLSSAFSLTSWVTGLIYSAPKGVYTKQKQHCQCVQGLRQWQLNFFLSFEKTSFSKQLMGNLHTQHSHLSFQWSWSLWQSCDYGPEWRSSRYVISPGLGGSCSVSRYICCRNVCLLSNIMELNSTSIVLWFKGAKLHLKNSTANASWLKIIHRPCFDWNWFIPQITAQKDVRIDSWIRGWVAKITKPADFIAQLRVTLLKITSQPVMNRSLSSMCRYVWIILSNWVMIPGKRHCWWVFLKMFFRCTFSTEVVLWYWSGDTHLSSWFSKTIWKD